MREVRAVGPQVKTDQILVSGIDLATARELAQENGLSEERVLVEIQREIDRLSHSGSVKQFVVLLAIKHVRAALASRVE